MTQDEMINQVLNGNQEAFRNIVEKYEAQIFRTCIGFVHNREDAEELTQDVFVNVYHHLHRFRGDSSFSTWIYRIAVNASLNHFRRQKRPGFLRKLENVFGLGPNDEKNAAIRYADSPEQLMIDKEMKTQLHKAIGSLPEKQRIAFTLSKYDDLTQREIAQILQVTEGAVEALLQRAKANLQKNLSGSFKKKKLPVGNLIH